MESKASIKNRLLVDNRWEEFIRQREAYKAAGESIEDAWQKAAADFPPLENGQAAAKKPMVPIRFEGQGPEPDGQLRLGGRGPG